MNNAPHFQKAGLDVEVLLSIQLGRILRCLGASAAFPWLGSPLCGICVRNIYVGRMHRKQEGSQAHEQAGLKLDLVQSVRGI